MKHKIRVECIFKVALQSTPFSDRIIMAQPFIEVKAHSLQFRGIQGLWKVPDEQHLKWMGLFSYAICVGTADVFPSELPSLRGEASSVPLLLPSAVSKAEGRGWLRFWKTETCFKGSYSFRRVWKQLQVFKVDGGLPGHLGLGLKVLSALWTFRYVLSPHQVS